MRGGPAAAQVVVVHAGQVVVHQGVGVHGLDRGGDAGDRRRLSADRAVGGEHQRRPHPLAGRPQRVGERLALAPADLGAQPLGPLAEQAVGAARAPRRADPITGAAAASAIEIGVPEISARLLEHGLDLELGGREPLAGDAEPRHALLEQRERGVELDVVGLELADDLLQAGKLVGDGWSSRAPRGRGRRRRRRGA